MASANLDEVLVAVSDRILTSLLAVSDISPELLVMFEDLILMLFAEIAVRFESRVRLLATIVSLLF